MSDSPSPSTGGPESSRTGPIEQDVSARALLRQGDYLRFLASRVLDITGMQVQSVALGWEVYSVARRTMDVPHAALAVSLLGAFAFIPILLLFLPAGEAADRHNRRTILMITFGVEALSGLILTVGAGLHMGSIPLLLGCAVLFGAARAYFAPANSAMAPMLVPRPLLPRALAWSSLAWQGSSILGPALAGLLIAVSPALAFGVSTACYLAAGLCIVSIRRSVRPEVQAGSRWALIKEGLAYVWSNKIVFGSISLDLFAVLLGGARAMLPVFSRDVLHVSANAFGLLSAAPAVGASLMGIYLAAHPIRRHAGLIMFWAVAAFGACTIGFGLSKLLWLSVGCMVVLGAADMISVFVRQTLVQLTTPDQMRGRVSAVSSLFIGASNELGDFESGLMARLLGPVVAVAAGGAGALLVTGAWAALFPALRKADRLT